MGGVVRFAQSFYAGDSGRDCDLEKKYAGKTRTKRIKTFNKATKNRLDTVRKQLRTCGIESDKIAQIMNDISGARK